MVHGALDGSMRGDDDNTKCDQYGGVWGVMLGDYLLGLLRGRSMQGVVVADSMAVDGRATTARG